MPTAAEDILMARGMAAEAAAEAADEAAPAAAAAAAAIMLKRAPTTSAGVGIFSRGSASFNFTIACTSHHLGLETKLEKEAGCCREEGMEQI